MLVDEAAQERLILQLAAPDLTELTRHEGAERDRVLDAPRLGGDHEGVELERQLGERIARHDVGEIAVDTRSICRENLPLLGGQAGELSIQLGIGVARDARDAVGIHEARAEDFRQSAARRPPVELELPETILGHRESVGLEQSLVGFGKDMGDAEFVAEYRGRFTVNREGRDADARCLRIGRKPAEEQDDTGQRREEHPRHRLQHRPPFCPGPFPFALTSRGRFSPLDEAWRSWGLRPRLGSTRA